MSDGANCGDDSGEGQAAGDPLISGEVRVGPSAEKGRCVFATRSYEPGDPVVVGRVERVAASRTNHSFQTGRDTHVDLDVPARLINHSCDPNTGIRDNEYGGFDFIALRRIAAAEEITWDTAMLTYSLVS